MKKNILITYSVLAVVFMLGPIGCKRTEENIADWKVSGNVIKLIQALEDPDRYIRTRRYHV